MSRKPRKPKGLEPVLFDDADTLYEAIIGGTPPVQNLAPATHHEADVFHEPAAVVTLHPTLAELVEQRRKGKVRKRDLGLVLAHIKIAYADHGQPRPEHVGAALFDIIAELIFDPEEWSRLHNDARRKKRRERDAFWQSLANPVWLRDREKKDNAVAKEIVTEPNVRQALALGLLKLDDLVELEDGTLSEETLDTICNTVRRRITKPPEKKI